MLLKMASGSTMASSLRLLIVLLLATVAAVSSHSDRATIDALDKKELNLDGSTSISEALDELRSSPDASDTAMALPQQRLSTGSECENTYGVLPCSTTIIGNAFLLIVYGYIMFKGAMCLSEGSEILLTVLDAGIIGGLLLPVLGVLPDALLILVSGLGGTKAEAQEQVLVGIGLLAGSTVLLLTLLWGSCLILGRCDLEVVSGQLRAKDKSLKKRFDLTGTGVSTDQLTTFSANIMTVTVLPFIIVQLPIFFNFSAKGNIPVLVACIISFGGLLSYCIYQVLTPKLWERRRAWARKILGKIVTKAVKLGNLVNDKDEINTEVLEQLFKAFDRNNDGFIDMLELQFFMKATMTQHGLPDEAYEHFMQEYDTDQDRAISKKELEIGLQNFLAGEKGHHRHSASEEAEILLDLEHVARKDEGGCSAGYEEDSDSEETEKPLTQKQIVKKAVVLLSVGAILAAVFADPLVDAVNGLSKVTKIPSFFISFVLLPLASNSSEAVSSLVFASRKRTENMSLTYSQIYGGVTMNNTIGLGIFLAIVYWRQLVWNFSSEVLVIVVVTVLMGLITGFRNTLPLWMAGVALSLYPVSLGLVAILDYVAGWE